jgi:hypothetical protein
LGPSWAMAQIRVQRSTRRVQNAAIEASVQVSGQAEAVKLNYLLLNEGGSVDTVSVMGTHCNRIYRYN